MLRWRTFLFTAVLALGLRAETSRAVIFTTDVDPNFNSTAPTGQYANSGWQFEGRTANNFVGTPIAPHYFITAGHIGPETVEPGAKFFFQNDDYTIVGFVDDLNSDLRIWQVAEEFSTYAPLYTKSDEVGKELVVFGRGPAHGQEIPGKGWKWGTMVTTLRWGTNAVAGITNDPTYGPLLQATFDLGVSATEGMLTERDSGGGLFIKDSDGVWKLAGINLSVSGPYRETPDGPTFNAALYDQSGFLAQLQTGGPFVEVSGPGSFFATRISSNMAFIRQVTGIPEPSVGLLGMCGLAAWAACARRRRPLEYRL